VAETDLAVVSNRARHAESLQAFADSLGSIELPSLQPFLMAMAAPRV
jgi:hypothetical protein